MSSDESPKPEPFDKIPAIIICQHNGTDLNFDFHFNVDQQTTFRILSALFENLTHVLPELEKQLNEKNQTPH